MYTPPPPRSCDDELTVLVTNMRPRHRMFADQILKGCSGTEAIRAIGYMGEAPQQSASALVRRPDVRRYLALMQRQAALAARISLTAIVERLWATVTDIQESPTARDRAMTHLVKIHTMGQASPPPAQPTGQGQGLTDDVVASIETQLLGIRPETP